MMNVRKIVLCTMLASILMPAVLLMPTPLLAQLHTPFQQAQRQQQQQQELGRTILMICGVAMIAIGIGYAIWHSTKAKCRYCRSIVAPDAPSCPKCGKANPTEKNL